LLASWLTLGIIAFGLGRIVCRLLRFPQEDDTDGWFTCWLGVTLSVTLLLCWNFWRPIDGAIATTLAVLGFASSWLSRRELAAACRATADQLGRAGLIVCVAFGLWLGNHSRGPLTYWDSGNYHIQAVRWAGAFPVVPGLANLHSRLGYQSAGFLYYAVIDTGPFRQKAHHVANGFLLFLLGAGALTSIFGYRPERSSSLRAAVAAGALTVTAAWTSIAEIIPSFATDVPTTAIGFAMAVAFAGLFDRNRRQAAPHRLMAVMYVAAIAVAFKLSLAPLAGVVILVGLGMLWRNSGSVRSRVQEILVASVLVALPVSLILARSVVASGYPLYPSSVLAFPVDWRVPDEQARSDMEWVRAVARSVHNEVGINPKALDFSNWAPRWLRTWRYRPFYVLVPIVIILTGAVALFFLPRRQIGLPPLLAAAPFVVGAITWWQTAPAMRWAVVPCWTIAAWVATALLERLSIRHVRSVLLLPSILAVLLGPALSVRQPDGQRLLHEFARGIVGPIGGNEWFQEHKVEPTLQTYVTDSGARLNFATGPDGQCWYAAIPCTPTPAKNVELRDPSQISRGFRVRGDWQPENWPEPWLPHFRVGIRVSAGPGMNTETHFKVQNTD